MEETIKKYQEYPFGQNKAWLDYFNGLFPTPPMELVEKKKRRWYKENIDQNLPLDFNEIPNTTNTPSQQNSNGANQQNFGNIPRNNSNEIPRGQESALNATLFKIEGYLKLAFIPGLLLLSGFHLKLLVVAVCLLAMVRNYGMPKLNKEYFIRLIPSEFFSNILYLLSISLTTPQNGFLFFLPIAIHLSSGIVEFVNRTNPSWFAINPKVSQIANIIKSNRNALIVAKHKVEFCIFVYLLVGIFIGRSSFFQIIIYLQFLNLKFKFNNNMSTAIWELRNYLVGMPSLPGVARNVISKFFELFMKAMNLF